MRPIGDDIIDLSSSVTERDRESLIGKIAADDKDPLPHRDR